MSAIMQDRQTDRWNRGWGSRALGSFGLFPSLALVSRGAMWGWEGKAPAWMVFRHSFQVPGALSQPPLTVRAPR